MFGETCCDSPQKGKVVLDRLCHVGKCNSTLIHLCVLFTVVANTGDHSELFVLCHYQGSFHSLTLFDMLSACHVKSPS